jgi:hypothetical protein
VRRNHLDTVAAQLLIQWIAVVSAIADKVLWLGLNHVEVETELNQRTSWWLAACVLTESGKPWRSTIAMIFRPFLRFVAPISAPPPLAIASRIDETFFFIQRAALAKLVGNVGQNLA